MASLSDLPVEIMQKIIQEVLFPLFECFSRKPIRSQGTNKLLLTLPHQIPSTHLRTLSNLSLTCRSIAPYVLPYLYKTFHIRIAGYKSAGHYVRSLLTLAGSENPFQPLRYVKDVVIDGYWKFSKEVDGDEYQIIHTLSTEPFDDASSGLDRALYLLMQSLLDLESFT